jgi:hypothetical protein
MLGVCLGSLGPATHVTEYCAIARVSHEPSRAAHVPEAATSVLAVLAIEAISFWRGPSRQAALA